MFSSTEKYKIKQFVIATVMLSFLTIGVDQYPNITVCILQIITILMWVLIILGIIMIVLITMFGDE